MAEFTCDTDDSMIEDGTFDDTDDTWDGENRLIRVEPAATPVLVQPEMENQSS
mgnify:CR=1 FL=1